MVSMDETGWYGKIKLLINILDYFFRLMMLGQEVEKSLFDFGFSCH